MIFIFAKTLRDKVFLWCNWNVYNFATFKSKLTKIFLVFGDAQMPSAKHKQKSDCNHLETLTSTKAKNWPQFHVLNFSFALVISWRLLLSFVSPVTTESHSASKLNQNRDPYRNFKAFFTKTKSNFSFTKNPQNDSK